jgi:hypothetical protein
MLQIESNRRERERERENEGVSLRKEQMCAVVSVTVINLLPGYD